MHVADSGLIYDASGRADHEKVTCFTSLCRLRSGTILAGFQVGPRKQDATANIRLCRSSDGGRSWRELPARFESRIGGVPGSPASAEMIEVAPGRLLLFSTWFDRSDPDRPLFDSTTEGILRTKQLLATSSDEGDTWSTWSVVPTPGLTGTALTGPPIQWSDGTLALALESFKEYDDPTPARHAAWLFLSRDGGRTFPERVLVAADPAGDVYYWDQRLCATSRPGEYVALFWTHDRRRQKDLTVHLRRATLADVDERALGIQATPVPGQIAAPCLLAGGRLLAFVVDRARPGTMSLWSSADSGASWPADGRLVVHSHEERAALSQGLEQVDFKQYWEDMGKWSFGHPAMRQLDSQQVLLAFYAGSPDRMSIHWSRVTL